MRALQKLLLLFLLISFTGVAGYSPTRIKATARYDGVNDSIVASKGISSIVRNNTGDYTVTLTAAQPTANYLVQITPASVEYLVIRVNSDNSGAYVAPTTTAFRFITLNYNGSARFNAEFYITVIGD